MEKDPDERVTIINFLRDSARRYAEHDCMQYLKRGEYVGITWEEVFEVTRLFSLGFQHLLGDGQKGARIALMSKTRYEWRLLDYGIMFAGATTVTIYPSLTAEQVSYIINDSESRIVVVDTPRNLKKVLSTWDQCPRLEYAICIEPFPDDMRSPKVLDLDQLIEKGNQFLGRAGFDMPAKLEKEIKKNLKILKKSRNARKIEASLANLKRIDKELASAGDPFSRRFLEIEENDIATIVYTSGTTGVPKGALLTHYNMAYNAIQTLSVMPLEQHDLALSFLPLSHVLERQVGQFMATKLGFTVAYARDTDSIIENLDQVKPTFITCVPRIYEKLYDRIIADVLSGSETKEKIFNHAVDWGFEYHSKIQDGEEVSILEALKNWIGKKLVFDKVHDILGGRLRFMFSGGAALNPVLARFYFAAGFKIMEGYGLTETSPVLTVNRLEKIKFGTVGPPVPETDVRIADDGEIICKGPQVFQGYWNKPAENADAFTEDGYYKTGDLGEFDDDGYLKITGRKKTVIVLRTGKKVSPVVVEAKLNLDRHIAHACVIGDDMKYLVGIIEPNFEYLAETFEGEDFFPWTWKDLELYKGMSKEAYEERMAIRRKIIEMPEIVAFYSKLVDELQEGLSNFEKIKRFALVPDEWNEYNVLTPSMKMRRAIIKEKYKDLIDKIYVE